MSLLIFLAFGGALLAACAIVIARERLAARRGLAKAHALDAACEAARRAYLAVDGETVRLLAGEAALAAALADLGLVEAEPRLLLEAIARRDPGHGRALRELFAEGRPCELALGQGWRLIGKARGAIAFVSLTPSPETAEDARIVTLLQSYPEPAWIASPSGPPLWGNQAWVEACGCADLAEAVRTRAQLDPALDRLIQQAAISGARAEAVIWTSRRGARWALNVQALPLADGGVGVWTRDVTQWMSESSTALSRVQHRDALLETLRDAVARFGADQKLKSWNEAFENLWSQPRAWLAGSPTHAEWLDRLRREGRFADLSDYAQFKSHELSRHAVQKSLPESLWRLSDGRRLRVVGVPDPDGGLAMVFSDVTAKLEIEAVFNRRLAAHKATLDRLSDAVAVFAPDGHLQIANQAFHRLWSLPDGFAEAGATFDDWTDHALRILPDQRFFADLKVRIANLEPAARTPAGGDLTTTADRALRWFTRPLPDGATMIGLSDCTDAVRLERETRAREKAVAEIERVRRDFVAAVSYLLRTPLTSILGFASMLDRQREAIPPGARSHLAAITEASAQLARSVDAIVLAAEVDAGDLRLDTRPVDLRRVAEAAAERWRARLTSGDAAIVLQAPAAPTPGLADARRLGEALDFLFEFALAGLDEGGVITLAVEPGPRLVVADDGRGVPYDLQSSVFERFSPASGGVGIGLSLVRAVVELHGGWVEMESHPGRGSTFTLHLPGPKSADSLLGPGF